jgi:hypothetical protein
MDEEADVEIVELPSEFRIIRWDDGSHVILNVSSKEGVPYEYDADSVLFDGQECVLASRAAVDAQIDDMIAILTRLRSLPTLSEAEDFPAMPQDDELEAACAF